MNASDVRGVVRECDVSRRDARGHFPGTRAFNSSNQNDRFIDLLATGVDTRDQLALRCSRRLAILRHHVILGHAPTSRRSC